MKLCIAIVCDPSKTLSRPNLTPLAARAERSQPEPCEDTLVTVPPNYRAHRFVYEGVIDPPEPQVEFDIYTVASILPFSVRVWPWSE